MMRTTIDIAGGRQGGAARFLHELDAYLADRPPEDVRVIGRTRQLTPRWLAEREVLSRGAERKIAINNASFVTGTERTALLGNALHFSSPEEFAQLGFQPSPALRAQIPVIHALSARATRLVVPCSAMADRVALYSPSLSSKLTVRFHPVSVPENSDPEKTDTVLVPIINSPYKQLDLHVGRLLDALEAANNRETRIIITDRSSSFSSRVAEHAQVDFVGSMPHGDLWRLWSAARAVYYPTHVEAFGYPLAEARASGVPIICQDSDQSREVAGPAACVFTSGDEDSLRAAVTIALTLQPVADPAPFNRTDYFNWLFGIGSER